MEVIILILIIILGIWLTVEDFRDREITAILSYFHLALLSFYIHIVNFHYDIFIALFILTVLITQFNKSKINYIDVFYVIFTCLILKYCMINNLSYIQFLPLLIGIILGILTKDNEKIPMVGICSIIISLSLIFNYI